VAALARPEAEVGVMAVGQTNDQAFDIASCEGIEYAVNGYSSSAFRASPAAFHRRRVSGSANPSPEQYLEKVTGRRFEDE
jgi:hypothetical protein